jgi:hypothetical protein
MKRSLDEMTKGKTISVTVQTVTIRQNIKAWVPDQEDELRERHTFPKECEPPNDAPPIDMDEFMQFLTTQIKLGDNTLGIYRAAMERLFHFLETATGDAVDFDGILVNMQMCGTLGPTRVIYLKIKS